jgi:hypothetical protein
VLLAGVNVSASNGYAAPSTRPLPSSAPNNLEAQSVRAERSPRRNVVN